MGPGWCHWPVVEKPFGDAPNRSVAPFERALQRFVERSIKVVGHKKSSPVVAERWAPLEDRHETRDGRSRTCDHDILRFILA